jgi:hypothetical protein
MAVAGGTSRLSSDDSSEADWPDEHSQLVRAGMELSEPSLTAVWDSPEDDVYNDVGC